MPIQYPNRQSRSRKGEALSLMATLPSFKRAVPIRNDSALNRKFVAFSLNDLPKWRKISLKFRKHPVPNCKLASKNLTGRVRKYSPPLRKYPLSSSGPENTGQNGKKFVI